MDSSVIIQTVAGKVFKPFSSRPWMFLKPPLGPCVFLPLFSPSFPFLHVGASVFSPPVCSVHVCVSGAGWSQGESSRTPAAITHLILSMQSSDLLCCWVEHCIHDTSKIWKSWPLTKEKFTWTQGRAGFFCSEPWVEVLCPKFPDLMWQLWRPPLRLVRQWGYWQ